MFQNFDVFHGIMRGGFTIGVLFLFSTFSIAVIIERLWFFIQSEAPKDFRIKVRQLLMEGDVEGARQLCVRTRGSSPRVVLSALDYQRSHDRSSREENSLRLAMENVILLESLGLERYLGVLGTIGNVAPFVGLFGTVLGIMRAFRDLASAGGMGDPAVVSEGIAEALVATAAGLFVAIPAVIAYNYFLRRSQRMTVEMSALAHDTGEMLCSR